MVKLYTLFFILFSFSVVAQPKSTANKPGGISNTEILQGFNVSTYGNYLEINGLSGEALKLQLVSLTGQTVRSVILSDNVKKLDTQGLNQGIYLLSVENARGQKAVRKVYVN